MGWLIKLPKDTRRISAELFRKLAATNQPKSTTPGARLECPPDLEERFSYQIDCEGLPTPVMEYRFHLPRRWRFDFAWPDRKIAAEIEGGTFSRRFKGRHTTGDGFHKDCEKYNTATLNGWQVYRFDSPMVRDGEAVAMMRKALMGDK